MEFDVTTWAPACARTMSELSREFNRDATPSNLARREVCGWRGMHGHGSRRSRGQSRRGNARRRRPRRHRRGLKKGAPKPEISTADAVKRTLLNAKSVSHSAEGASGVYLQNLLKRLGRLGDLFRRHLENSVHIREKTGNFTKNGKLAAGRPLFGPTSIAYSPARGGRALLPSPSSAR